MAPRFVTQPEDFSTGGKTIEQYVGGPDAPLSVARMVAPAGWSEPGQTPEFEETTLVISGALNVEHEGGVIEVGAGQAVTTRPGEWVRYSTSEPCTYVSVCAPAFSEATVHRDG